MKQHQIRYRPYNNTSNNTSTNPDVSGLCAQLSAQERANRHIIHPFLKRTILKQQMAMRGNRYIK